MLSHSSTFVAFANKLIQYCSKHTLIKIFSRKKSYTLDTHNISTGVTHHILINLQFTSQIMIGNSNIPSAAPDVSEDGNAEVTTRVRQGSLLPDTVVGKRVG